MRKALNEYIDTLKTRNILILTITTFFYSLTFYSTVSTLFLKSRGLDYFQIFLLESVISASIFIFEVPSGILADKLGRKKVIVFSVACFTLSLFIFAVSHSFIFFALESAIFGLGIASMSGADSALIYESLKKDDKKEYSDNAFSLLNGSITLAMVISLPIGGFLAQYSIDIPIYATCVTSTIALVIVIFLEDGASSNTRNKSSLSIMRANFYFVLKDRPKLLILQALNTISFGIILSLSYLNQPLFESYKIDIKYFGLIMLVTYFFSTAFTLAAPTIKKRLGIASTLFIVNVISGVLLIIVSKVSIIFIGLLALMGSKSINAIKNPIYQTFLNEQIDKRDRSTILSIISFFGSIIGMLFKPLIGYLSDIDLKFAFCVMGVIMIFVAIGMLITLKSIIHNDISNNLISETEG